MDVKNKQVVDAVSLRFTCSGTFPTIGGFVLAADVTTYTSDYGSCDPCYWNTILPLDGTIDSLSDPDIDISATAVISAEATPHHAANMSKLRYRQPTPVQFLNSTTETRNIQYFCSKVYVVQRVTISVRAFMCEEFDGFIFTNQLYITVSYKWEFSFRFTGYGRSINYRRPTGGGPEPYC